MNFIEEMKQIGDHPAILEYSKSMVNLMDQPLDVEMLACMTSEIYHLLDVPGLPDSVRLQFGQLGAMALVMGFNATIELRDQPPACLGHLQAVRPYSGK